MYTMFHLKIAQDGIYYFENVISYEKELVDLINEVDLDPRSIARIPHWEPWYSSNDLSTMYGQKKFINTSDLKTPTGCDLLDKKTLYIVNSLLMAPELCAINFCKFNKIDQSEINLDLSHVSLNRYDSGQAMGPHYDGQDGDSNLKYSFVTYLNDDYEGGEINFPNQNLTIKPKAGSLVMFPSQKPYIHESKPVLSGVKYMYTTHWVE
jgi:hypothetical protein